MAFRETQAHRRETAVLTAAAAALLALMAYAALDRSLTRSAAEQAAGHGLLAAEAPFAAR